MKRYSTVVFVLFRFLGKLEKFESRTPSRHDPKQFDGVECEFHSSCCCMWSRSSTDMERRHGTARSCRDCLVLELWKISSVEYNPVKSRIQTKETRLYLFGFLCVYPVKILKEKNTEIGKQNLFISIRFCFDKVVDLKNVKN